MDPISLDVEGMVSSDRPESAECILCGSCADACPNKAIRLGFGRPGEAVVKTTVAEADAGGTKP